MRDHPVPRDGESQGHLPGNCPVPFSSSASQTSRPLPLPQGRRCRVGKTEFPLPFSPSHPRGAHRFHQCPHSPPVHLAPVGEGQSPAPKPLKGEGAAAWWLLGELCVSGRHEPGQELRTVSHTASPREGHTCVCVGGTPTPAPLTVKAGSTQQFGSLVKNKNTALPPHKICPVEASRSQSALHRRGPAARGAAPRGAAGGVGGGGAWAGVSFLA